MNRGGSEYVINYKVESKATKSSVVECKKQGQTRGRMKKRTSRKNRQRLSR